MNQKRVRTSAKAIIIKDGKVLLTAKKSNDEIYYLLPGGGQRHGENLRDAVIRECYEETGATIAVGDLIFVRDYISNNHEFAEVQPNRHQLELYFECTIKNEPGTATPTEMDTYQIGFEWAPLESIENYNLYPSVLKTYLKNFPDSIPRVYLGDIN